jgi:hypothetical protein
MPQARKRVWWAEAVEYTVNDEPGRITQQRA